ncbi:hypothetical protein ASPCAL05103 [Aspergillus calidoustus]|uniref:Uncharacterized protein n=1 Tax=Aspergillus calidoustus TaxID=454130 RepID=A0A0U5FWP7_ASPCI|nr:hypothetical protein ASPCAL05103 [Aspergillus calidoustus]
MLHIIKAICKSRWAVDLVKGHGADAVFTFPSSLNATQLGGAWHITLRELMMFWVLDEITDKKDWETKMFNDEIVSNWKEDCWRLFVAYWAQQEGLGELTDRSWQWVMHELRYRAKQRGEHGKHAPIPVFETDVVESDYAVPVSLKEALRAAVSVLENVPEAGKDYHPWANEQVLDLIHPSLFLLVFRLSRVMVDVQLSVSQGITLAGKGEVINHVRDN